jgi:hypothetical protein
MYHFLELLVGHTSDTELLEPTSAFQATATVANGSSRPSLYPPVRLSRIPIPSDFWSGPFAEADADAEEPTFGRLVPYLVRSMGVIALGLYRQCPVSQGTMQWVDEGPSGQAWLFTQTHGEEMHAWSHTECACR